MKQLKDIIVQMESVGIAKEKLKEPLVRRLQGIIEDRENIFYFTKAYYGVSNGLLFLTSKGVLFVGDKGNKKLYVERIEGERVENIHFDLQMFNNSTLTIVTRNTEFIFESINKEEGHLFMASYKRYHGVVFGKKSQNQSTPISDRSSVDWFIAVIAALSILLFGLFIYVISQMDFDKTSSSKKEREVFLKEGSQNFDSGKVVLGDNSEFDVAPNFNFASSPAKKQITEVLKAKKPAEKKEEVNKLNDLISQMGKMVVEGFVELTTDERIILMLENEDGTKETVEIKKGDFKESVKENTPFNKNILNRFSCSGKAELNKENNLVLTGCQ